MKSVSRKRAVGTRDRVVSYLSRAGGEITDASGMASTGLADAIGYPGSSVAFAQLLSGMERAGLIEREIRGKRTYRIALGPAASGAGGRRVPARQGAAVTVAARQDSAPAPAAADGRDLVAAAAGSADFDYDELARRLLVQVVQRLTAAPDEQPLAAPGQPGPEDAGLATTVASLEQKLASVRSRQRKLTAENARLREQLHAAQQGLAQAEERGRGGQLDSAEVRLLERLLSPLREPGDRHEEAGAS